MTVINNRTVDPEDEGYCIHGMALDLPCTTCSGKDVSMSGPKGELDEISLVIGAKIEGQCPECNLPIHIGQLIIHCSMGWVHEKCH